MTPGDIIEKCQTLNVAKTRQMDEGYAEVVFYTKDLEQWDEALTGVMGPAQKRRNRKPSREQQGLARKFGGLRHDQTLFVKQGENGTIVAMFWPWRDRTHTTLKLGFL